LEVHVQLKTASKIFSSDAADFGKLPNQNVSVISLGHPGTLPKLNREVVAMGIRMALACEGEISRTQIFDRKNYFYPDLPKGYQITQDRSPLCRNGSVLVQTRSGTIRVLLEKIHMEEDAGKSIHLEAGTETALDFNRAGVPLLEIVTKPVINSAADASAFVMEVRKIVRYLGISDGNMEEGSLRCDANVSVKPKGAKALGKKVEIKNLNSVRNLSHAIEYDIDRQIGLIESGNPVVSETRTFDTSTGKTSSLRTKEELNDYRYFPDPDVSPLVISEEWINLIKGSMPELPQALVEKFVKEYQLSVSDSVVLTDSRESASYFEELCKLTKRYKAAANWMIGPVRSYLNETGMGMDEFPIRPDRLGSLINLVEEGQISFSTGVQKVFPLMTASTEKEPGMLVKELNLVLDRDEDALLKVVDAVIREFPLKVEAFKNGKTGIVTMFMGEVMKRTKGKADPKTASELITKKLSEI
jgi:aspartyl-tRNA(Asn)/glutamyl-tRNA(Gln) amidotransferase subunit B